MPGVTESSRIDAVLDDLGLGRLDWATATPMSGRNDNWLGDTTGGRRVFVKRLVGTADETAHGLRRTEAFYRTERPGALRTTTLIGQDEHAGVQVFDCLPQARTGQQVVADKDFGHALAAEAGAALGALHSVGPGRLAELEPSLPALPQHNPVHGLTEELFYDSSLGQLEAWRMVQQDTVIADVLGKIGDSTVKVPIHGDLRLDQFLVSRDRLYLTDWEMFQLADPARDVGGFVGEWLYHAVVDLLQERTRTAGRLLPPPTVVLAPDRPPWREARPAIASFWQAYAAARPQHSAEVAARTPLYVAWHLVERMLIDAQPRTRLDGTALTLFRMARTILLRPEHFVSVLGLSSC
ncbi:class V lanthionine synthetase subunit LxmK [Lentzea sp. NPDC051213]|uniref:class V lanthionine synthetase subunit LxmK n=1 Tax=Lentzea sp. NPDC051213 TaxID=3364126 RepID=UPI00379F3466